MLPHSEEFAAAVLAGAPTVVEATILRAGETILTGLVLDDPKVTVDEFADSRYALTATVYDDGSLAPRIGSDPLMPFGNELALRVGYDLPGGPQFVAAGVYRLEVTQSDTDGKITLTGLDRSVVVAAARNEQPYVVAANTSLADAWRQYLQAKYPGVPMIVDGRAEYISVGVTPKIYEEGDRTGNPWSNLRDLPSQFGFESFFDATGAAILRPVPDLTNSVIVMEYVKGPGNLAVSGTARFSGQDAYNVVVVTGEGPGIPTPIRSVAEVTDPSSPVYPGGAFRRRPRFLVSSFLTTQAQVDATAATMILAQAGVTEDVGFTAVPHPAHEAGDLVRYRTEEGGGRDVSAVLSGWQMSGNLRSTTSYKTRRLG